MTGADWIQRKHPGVPRVVAEAMAATQPAPEPAPLDVLAVLAEADHHLADDIQRDVRAARDLFAALISAAGCVAESYGRGGDGTQTALDVASLRGVLARIGGDS